VAGIELDGYDHRQSHLQQEQPPAARRGVQDSVRKHQEPREPSRHVQNTQMAQVRRVEAAQGDDHRAEKGWPVPGPKAPGEDVHSPGSDAIVQDDRGVQPPSEREEPDREPVQRIERPCLAFGEKRVARAEVRRPPGQGGLFERLL